MLTEILYWIILCGLMLLFWLLLNTMESQYEARIADLKGEPFEGDSFKDVLLRSFPFLKTIIRRIF